MSRSACWKGGEGVLLLCKEEREVKLLCPGESGEAVDDVTEEGVRFLQTLSQDGIGIEAAMLVNVSPSAFVLLLFWLLSCLLVCDTDAACCLILDMRKR